MRQGLFLILLIYVGILELLIGGEKSISQRKFFLFLNENICCDPSLEPSR